MSARCANAFDGGKRRASRETDLITPDASFFELSSLAMCALPASQRANPWNPCTASAYLESVPVIPAQSILDLVPTGRLVSVHARHPRTPRTLAQPGHQRVHGGRCAMGLELDASVGKVANPAVDAQATRL